MPTPTLTLTSIVAILVYLGLAVLGWGGVAAFFSHPARIALVIVLLAMSGAALFSRRQPERGREGWRVIAGHVSVIDEPARSATGSSMSGEPVGVAQADPMRQAGAIVRARRTLAEELRLQLADDIVRGILAPGSALDETELPGRFRVSRAPVREALRQVAASGLIEARAHRGAIVARPSHERLLGMFEAMAELEALCAGLAAQRMTGSERRRLEGVERLVDLVVALRIAQLDQRAQAVVDATIYGGRTMPNWPNWPLRRAGACSRSGAPSSTISAGWPSRTRSTIASSTHRAQRSQGRGRRDAAPHHASVRGIRGLCGAMTIIRRYSAA